MRNVFETPTLQDLQDTSQFELLSALSHAEMIPFIRKAIRTRTPIAYTFWTGMALSFLPLLWLINYPPFHPIEWQNKFLYFFAGVGSFFLFIPLHEWIHGLMYKNVGAPKVTYLVQWRKLLFLAAADKFVIGHRSFYRVAFMPFIVISIMLVGAFILSHGILSWMISGILIMHTQGCIGDFALSAYLQAESKAGEVYNYDDLESATTFFYRRLVI